MVFLVKGRSQGVRLLGSRRAKALVKGIVQGVGFRPFIYHLASRYSLTGYVANTSQGVDLEVEGREDSLTSFLSAITSAPPPLAYISDLSWAYVAPRNERGFVIRASESTAERSVIISPDMCVCEDCLAEMRNPRDRRYRYPFINCTNCGPRYTIVKDIPYDRDFTTMREFLMCPACLEEYNNPLDRRFHAQPNACWDCGPRISLHDRNGRKIEANDPVFEAIGLLSKGKIVAIKGLGGFHLAVDAENESAVKALRKRKNREEKPFAVMTGSLETAAGIGIIDDKEADILLSPQRPIVLIRKRKGHGISPKVAPKNSYFGIMLPYTPIHHLLMDGPYRALVMTSGNRSEEPITITNEAAMRDLSDIADFFLLHNRDIHLRSDDSVVRVFKGKPQHLRRSRGYVPVPVFLPPDIPFLPCSIGLGGGLKSTVCLQKGGRAFLSQHIGDMENLETFEFFKLTIDHLKKILEAMPRVAVHDLHPDYLSTRYAESLEGIESLQIQHHHAHIVSCMAENGFMDPVIGVALDGTGYGPDKTVWGGEILLADVTSFRRIGHLDQVPLPGGDAAARNPWRMAVVYLHKAFGEGFVDLDLPFIRMMDSVKVKNILRMGERGLNSPLTSSCGRLFDAVSAILGIRGINAYEGQAAIELEMCRSLISCEPYPWIVRDDAEGFILETAPIIRGIVEDILSGFGISLVSARFHAAIVGMVSEAVTKVRDKTGLSTVALSGGCFQNLAILKGLADQLQGMGFRVILHTKVPTNDGGISLGQAVFGAFKASGHRGIFSEPSQEHALT